MNAGDHGHPERRKQDAQQGSRADPGEGEPEPATYGSGAGGVETAGEQSTITGLPPLRYLNSWRMLLAQRALRDGDVRLGSLAADLGYASESTFSTAFKREVGESPLRYRYRVRVELPTNA
jgi:hypothetical protein